MRQIEPCIACGKRHIRCALISLSIYVLVLSATGAYFIRGLFQ